MSFRYWTLVTRLGYKAPLYTEPSCQPPSVLYFNSLYIFITYTIPFVLFVYTLFIHILILRFKFRFCFIFVFVLPAFSIPLWISVAFHQKSIIFLLSKELPIAFCLVVSPIVIPPLSFCLILPYFVFNFGEIFQNSGGRVYISWNFAVTYHSSSSEFFCEVIVLL